jgi:hypothetical protein
MSPAISLNATGSYEIKIHGQLDGSWLAWFGESAMFAESFPDGSQVTILTNIVMDQAGLVGLIRRLHGLGIVLLSIRRL